MMSNTGATENAQTKPIELALQTNIGRRSGSDVPFSLDVDLTLPGQGITVIFGASGSGKTSLLRCLAGLQAVDSGNIVVNGETWHNSAMSLSAHRREVGYVFQEASLFSHLTAEGNLRYAMKRARADGNAFELEQIVELLGIQPVLQQKPDQLSGGERQRVAIARALLINPRLLLMDEPLAALDYTRRAEILPYLERLHQDIALPVVYVTHSMEEVSRLADYLVMLEAGKVVAEGNPVDLLSRLDLPFLAGEEAGALLEGEVVEVDKHWHLARVRFDGGELLVRDSSAIAREQQAKVRLRILARDISLSLEPEQRSSILNRLPATIATIADDRDPAMATVQLQLGNNLLLSRISRRSVADLALAPGKPVWAQMKSVAILR